MQKSKQEIREAEAKEISVSMKRLVTGYRSLLEAAIESEGLTLAQLRMLNALQEQPETSAADLARTCYITPQSMQAVVTRAEREGWITRSPSPTNRRVLTASLTAKGRKVYERGMELWSEIARQTWDGAKLSELRTLNELLGAAVDRLQPRLDALHGKSASKRKTA
ncbi:transcriptional regulator [Terriglobus roseus DSM 18391]|uniref:Transcriptional regulator n=1 Tax=Terriglobus roseus (strain DSM 18391 / NRRL B-41598 / KBS 63) TaxID=926566 RepID=I3ZCL8_TERRK|nr:MarR family transcriptional regulator [Terriglobus roseus]AFL86986.1 transcriptional regulator [Terriglobus roseus DSM 18391]